MTDMDVLDFADMLTLFDPDPNLTVECDIWGSPYNTQKTHMVLWCRDQVNARGKGPYGRTKSNHSAKTMYNRFNNPGGLLWMAEVLGEEEWRLRRALDRTIAEESVNKRGRCNAFRAVIPWERIMELMSHPERWILDPALMPFEFNDHGFPVITDDWHEDYLRVIHSEIYLLLG